MTLYGRWAYMVGLEGGLYMEGGPVGECQGTLCWS